MSGTALSHAYIALGANLGDPAAQIRTALTRLSAMPGLKVIAISQFYRTAPIGPAGQPDYCNAACQIESALSPLDLLAILQDLERQAGRIRGGERWSARVLDLDLLHVAGVQLDTSALRLPHPEMAKRNFVLIPLAEIAPSLSIPGVGSIGELAQKIDREGLEPWSSASVEEAP